MSMKSLTRIGIGLSVVFTCLLLALVAEIYYLLWWKRRIIMNNREIKDENSNNTREFCFKFCWKKPYKSSLDSTRVADSQFHQHQIPQENNKQDYLVKPLDGGEENGVLEGELMGPPRFLFTINEETKEDLLEYEDRKSKSLSDLLSKNNNNINSSNATISPNLTPISSPPFLTPFSNHSSSGGYNPLYEASSDAEFNNMVKLSPPPKFKFLRDAEEKLQKKLIFMEEAKLERDLHRVKEVKNANENGSFISVVVDENNSKDDKINHNYYHFPHSLHSDDSSSTSTSTSCSSSSTLGSSSSRKFKSFLTI